MSLARCSVKTNGDVNIECITAEGKVESFQHQLQKFDPGIIWLSQDNRVVAMNGVAAQVLGADLGQVVGTEILKLHPEKSRDKVAWLLESTRCPADSPPPQTMMINIPDRVLLMKVSKMMGMGEFSGTCMVFYDLTDTVTVPRKSVEEAGRPRLLFKLPVYRNNKIVLVDISQVIFFKAEGHYTSIVTEHETYLCNLSLSDLEERLDQQQYVRTHRSYMVNIRYAAAFEKVDESYVIGMHIASGERIPVSRGNVHKIKMMLGLV